MRELSTLEKFDRIVRAGKASADYQGRCRIESIQTSGGYAEPGYSDPESGLIAVGDWNRIDRYNPETCEFELIDDTLERMGDLFGRIGVEIEWSDEWCFCEDCRKAFRTVPDRYGWIKSYVTIGDYRTILCGECVKSDPSEYLGGLEGDCDKYETLGVDLEGNGYVELGREFENRYGGGCDTPLLIGKALRSQGVEKFIFRLGGIDQFTKSFSVWLHKSELSKLDFEPAEGLKKAGTATSKPVCPQDFAESFRLLFDL